MKKSKPNACEVDKLNVQNPNEIVPISDVWLYCRTTSKSAEIQMFGFPTLIVQWNAEIRTSSNRTTPKSERLIVRTNHSSDFGHWGLVFFVRTKKLLK